MSDIKVVELFAGVGGFRLGLEGYDIKKDGIKRSSSSNYEERFDSPYKVVWSNQWEPSTKTQHANLVYEARWAEADHCGKDINTIANSDIPDEKIKQLIPEHDMLVGGFPCQDYSVAGVNTNGIQGKKGVLWWNIHRILEVRRPKYVLLENVDRLLKSPTDQRGRDFAIVLSTMSDLGYSVEWKVVNAADYGMPQRRRRVFIMGVHKDAPLNIECSKDWLDENGIMAASFPSVLKGNIKHFDIVGSAEDITSDYDDGKFLNSGVMRKREVITCDFTPNIPEGESFSKFHVLSDFIDVEHKNIPEEYFVDDKKELLRPLTKIQRPGTDLSYIPMNGDLHVELKTELDKWKYLKGRKAEERKSSKGIFHYTEGPLKLADPIDQPARTIITSEGGPGASRFKHLIEIEHNKLYRRLTPVELELATMFPKDHTKHNNVSDSKRAFFMGNALVVGVVERIGRVVAEHIGTRTIAQKRANLLQRKTTKQDKDNSDVLQERQIR